MSESQCSCIFQEPLNRGNYAYFGLFVKYGLGKSSHVSKIPPVQAKNRIITVSVFRSTLQLTALLLKSFRLRLHCYTLRVVRKGPLQVLGPFNVTPFLWTDFESRVNYLEVRTLYQDCALTSVRSQNDLKVPRKLIDVTNISISTENRISKSVY